MKRIINGKTYNTDTAHAVARSEEFDPRDKSRVERTLYVTRGGAFFRRQYTQDRYYDDENREWVTETANYIEPMTRTAAEKWVYGEHDQVELVGSTFPEPPEASEQDETEGVSMLVRMPASLKRTIEAQAKAASQSANAWAIRCFESCTQKA